MPDATKVYDRRYFDRWYRDPRHRVVQRGLIERRVRFALAAAEFLLDRPIRSMLDVGCGEGSWFPILRRLRPGVRYTGVDSSEYAVRRFGRRRNLRLGTFGGLGRLRLRGPFDLIVCSDVLHYVPTAEARRGLAAIARLLGGIAFIELYAVEDEAEGDEHGFRRRRATMYRRLLRGARLLPLGLNCYASERLRDQLTALELAPGPVGGLHRA